MKRKSSLMIAVTFMIPAIIMAWQLTSVEAGVEPGLTINKTVDFDGDSVYTDLEVNSPGKQASWKIVVTNTGSVPLTNLTVTDTNGMEFSQARLLPGSTAEWIYDTTVHRNTVNIACATADFLEDTLDPVCDPAEVNIITMSNCDLEVTKTADGSTFDVGQVVTYTVTITNNGPSDATNVKVEDVLPAGVNFESSSLSLGFYFVMSGLWDVGDLAMGASATLEIEATVNTAGDILNCASSLPSDSHDPDIGNNAQCVTITGIPGPPADSWCCQLDEGINLISLPLIPENGDPAAMLLGLDFAQVSMYMADGDLSSDDWLYYLPPPAPSDALFFADGYGYLIDMEKAGELCFDGYELVAPPPALSPSYDVELGWNLVGFKSTTPKLPSEYLAGIAGKYVIIYGFADGAYFIAGSPGHEYLQPCHGYWIAVAEEGTIYP
ncbi:DUF11 domain-containing protein [Chloroflexota bacterium]